jgi:hypothetical protein
VNKIIISPNDCKFRYEVKTRLDLPIGFYTCTHKSQVAGTTCGNKDDSFPIYCPLQDGHPTPHTIKELIQIAKKEGLLYLLEAKNS